MARKKLSNMDGPKNGLNHQWPEQKSQTLMALKKADPECKFVVRLLDHVNGCDADPLESLVLEAGIISLEAWLRERQYQPSWSVVMTHLF